MWQALNDTSVLKRCIDGCESFEQDGPGAFKASVRAHIGPVNALFAAKITLVEEPSAGNDVQTDVETDSQTFRIGVELERAPQGFGKGEAEVKLVDQAGATTLLTYEIKADVGGKLAQLGARLIDSAARSMAGSFFEQLESVLTGKASTKDTARRKWLPWAAAGLAALALAVFALQ